MATNDLSAVRSGDRLDVEVRPLRISDAITV